MEALRRRLTPARKKQLLKLWRPLGAATGPLRVLPRFLVIGAQRSGTTSLLSNLARHPSILAGWGKEINFFSYHYSKGLNWYRGHFPTAAYVKLRRQWIGEPSVCGEASPSYMHNADAPNRARLTIPELKLIAILRNPVDRAYSHYHHNVRLGLEQRSFEEALRAEREQLTTEGLGWGDSFGTHAYIGRGAYAPQLERWLAAFPRQQLLVIESEDMFSDPKGVLTGVFSFLEVSPQTVQEYKPRNTAEYPAMARETKDQLTEWFAPYNQRLQALLGQTFSWPTSGHGV